MYVKLNSQLDRYQQVVEPLRRLAMYGIPIVLGIFLGVSTATRWTTVLQFLNRTPFGQVDPQFHLDVSFYVYELPFYRGILAYASAILLVAGLAALATSYLYGGIRISGREVRVTRPARIQLAIMAAALPRAAGGQHLARPVRHAHRRRRPRSPAPPTPTSTRSSRAG